MNLNTECLALMKAVDVHGCDVLSIADRASRLQIELNKLPPSRNKETIQEGIRVINRKLGKKAEARNRLGQR